MSLRFALVGRRSHRTPLSYQAYQSRMSGLLHRVDAFRSPDILVFGHPDDIVEELSTVHAIQSFNPDVRIVVLSEEPFWDLNRQEGFLEKDGTIQAGDSGVHFKYLNHETCGVYRFDRIPYYITTDDEFLARYRLLLQRYAGCSREATLARWQGAKYQAAFFAEKRTNEKFDKAVDGLDIQGLSRFRSLLTYHYDLPATLKVGRGWVKGGAKRQVLPDWHLDKLTQLNGCVRLMSAIENTHQRDYVTEKLLDAYSVGGVPLYYASPSHRVHELAPNDSFINLYGHTYVSAGEAVKSFELTPAFAERYLADLQGLLIRLNGEALIAERDRVLKEVVKEFEKCVNAD